MFKKAVYLSIFLLAEQASAQVFHQADAEVVHEFTGSTIVQELYPIGNKLLYLRTLSGGKGEMWVSDGTMTQKLSDTIAGLHDQLGTDAWQGIANIGNQYYLAPLIKTDLPGQTEQEPFVTDGTISGTGRLADLNPNTSTQAKSSAPRAFVSFDDALFFCAQVDKSALYRHDGVSAPTIVKNDFYMTESIVYNGKLYMAGSANNGQVKGLFRMASAQSVPELVVACAGLRHLQVLGNQLIFTANNNPNVGLELYKYEEATDNLSLVKDLVAGSSSPIWGDDPAHRNRTTGRVSIFVVQGGYAFFHIQDPTTSTYKIYRSDGTDAGTVSIFESQNTVQSLYAAGNRIIFYGTDPVSGKVGLMATDGQTPPTLIKNDGDFYYRGTFISTNGTFAYNSSGEWLSTAKAFGLTSASQSVECLIITDGTELGTKFVKVNFPPNSWLTNMTSGWFAVINGHLYFLAGNFLYRIDLNAITIAPTSIRELDQQASSIEVFPNPLHDRQFSVEAPKEWEGTVDVRLSDYTGRNLMDHKVLFRKGKGLVTVPSLSPGTYLVCFRRDGKEFYKKIVVR